MSPLFQFDDIVGGYGEVEVVRGVSGQIEPGRVVGVTGRNGVGKSTLLKLLFGSLPLIGGAVRFRGRDLKGTSPAQRSRDGISFCPQERIVFDNLGVWENLSLMQSRAAVEDFAVFFEVFPRLRERLRQHAGTLSGGERKMLSFMRTMSEGKTLALLDEPTEGVQQENIDHMTDLVLQARHDQRSFVIVEQNIHFLENVADYLIVMDQGRIVLEGPAVTIKRADIIAHLGV
jgi:branched-chain amino acid transport system ATP-binding protein|tara:strand:- start:83 stop:775 length:693 start_codon:yes stop_codon:yes gene_type:complete